MNIPDHELPLQVAVPGSTSSPITSDWRPDTLRNNWDAMKLDFTREVVPGLDGPSVLLRARVKMPSGFIVVAEVTNQTGPWCAGLRVVEDTRPADFAPEEWLAFHADDERIKDDVRLEASMKSTVKSMLYALHLTTLYLSVTGVLQPLTPG